MNSTFWPLVVFVKVVFLDGLSRPSSLRQLVFRQSCSPTQMIPGLNYETSFFVLNSLSSPCLGERVPSLWCWVSCALPPLEFELGKKAERALKKTHNSNAKVRSDRYFSGRVAVNQAPSDPATRGVAHLWLWSAVVSLLKMIWCELLIDLCFLVESYYGLKKKNGSGFESWTSTFFFERPSWRNKSWTPPRLVPATWD